MTHQSGVTESGPVATATGSGSRGATGIRTTRRWVERLKRWRRSGGIATLLFSLPIIAIFALFSWWPILQGLMLAFQHTNLVSDPTWVGLTNFERVLADPLLGTAVWNTTWYTLLAIVIGFPVPLIFAVFIAELRRGKVIASTLAYTPVIIPPVVSVLLWKQFYDPRPEGLFNTMLGTFGLDPLPWLQSPAMAMPAIVVQATWATFGTATLVYAAALASVQTELYDAAEVDGASIGRRFWHVMLPQLRGVILLLLLLQIIGTFQVFTEPFIMTGGGPVNSTTTLLMLIYRYAFVYGDYGAAIALSVLLAVALSGLSALYLWATRRWSAK